MQRQVHWVLITLLLLTPAAAACQSKPQPAFRTNSPHAAPGNPVMYTNLRYGFSISLPRSWKGYSVLERNWGGSVNNDADTEEDGTLLLIRHPAWTEENPREDIPIMVFTTRQWRMICDSSLIVSAAPIAPSEIARNPEYVFATPPRFFFDYLDGYEEVLEIVGRKPIRTFLPSPAYK